MDESLRAPFRRLCIGQLISTTVITLILLMFVSWERAASFAIGGVVFGISIIASWYAWKGIFRKKNVALSVSLIVIKYPVLVLLVLVLAKSMSIHVGWFVGGIASFKIPILYEMWIAYRKYKAEDLAEAARLHKGGTDYTQQSTLDS